MSVALFLAAPMQEKTTTEYEGNQCKLCKILNLLKASATHNLLSLGAGAAEEQSG